MGDNSTASLVANPVLVSGLTNANSVSVGTNHTCAILSDKTIKCWGDYSYGQLGTGASITGSKSLTPVSVSSITNALSLANRVYQHNCAILEDSSLKCWGHNLNYNLGDGTKLNRYSPVTPTGIAPASSVAIGTNRTSIISDGSIYYWGDNTVQTPRLFSGVSSAVDIANGDDYSCALLSDKTVNCWGANSSGQLGDGTTTNRSTPVTVQF